MDKGQIAKNYFSNGYNCSQAVAMAFEEKIGLDKNQIARLTSGFGGGMGRLREVCGAFSGAVFVISSVFGSEDVSDSNSKKELYQKIQDYSKLFKLKNHSIVCRELLGLDKNDELSPIPQQRNGEYYKKRPCPDIVESAAKILEEFLDSD